MKEDEFDQGQAFTLADLFVAVQRLREANIPPLEDGNYVIVMHPYQASFVRLDEHLCSTVANYAERDVAWALLRHEQRRKQLGRRWSWPTAEEVLARALGKGWHLRGIKGA